MIFTNRELAIGIWFSIFLIWVLHKPNVRHSCSNLVRTIIKFNVIFPICIIATYTVFAVILLTFANLWNMSLLKDTVVWFCIAIATMVRFITAANIRNFTKELLIPNINLIIIFEFIINTYTFSLPIELVLIPIATLIALLDAFMSHNNQYNATLKILKKIQLLLAIAIISIAIYRACYDIHHLKTLDTLRSILLAPLLFILYSPLLYCMLVASKYELLFIRLNLGINKSVTLKNYAKRSIILSAGLNLKKLEQILNHSSDIMNIQTKADIDQILSGSVIQHYQCDQTNF